MMIRRTDDPDKLVAHRPIKETLHPSWAAFIEFCSELGHGELERLVIQNGIPVLAEQTRKKVKFTP